MSRWQQPSIAFSIASGRPSSRKNSAGPPMPNEVRDARVSSAFTPASARSQVRLDLVRQLIAQLLDVTRAHEQDQVVRADDLRECFLRLCEISDKDAVRDLVGEVFGADTGNVFLAGAVDIEHVDPVGAPKRSRKVMHQGMEPGIAVRL